MSPVGNVIFSGVGPGIEVVSAEVVETGDSDVWLASGGGCEVVGEQLTMMITMEEMMMRFNNAGRLIILTISTIQSVAIN
jgi:hypothetical protein